MSVIESRCPEPNCKEKTTFWAGGYLQHKTEHDYDRACPKNKEKYRLLMEKWKQERWEAMTDKASDGGRMPPPGAALLCFIVVLGLAAIVLMDVIAQIVGGQP